MITAEELYYKSIEQQVTHRKSWEQIGEMRQFEFEAFAHSANQLFNEQKPNFDQKTDELAIERGLQIREFPTKWKQAKDMALRMRKDRYAEESAFEWACRVYLELGGESKQPFYDVLNSQVLIQPENT